MTSRRLAIHGGIGLRPLSYDRVWRDAIDITLMFPKSKRAMEPVLRLIELGYLTPEEDEVERELFGQAPLNEIHGPTTGKELEQQLRRLEEHLLLLERCHRMVARSLVHLEARRAKHAKTSVTVGQAGQVNVDCAVMNNVPGIPKRSRK